MRLIVDGDLLLYRASAAVEKPVRIDKYVVLMSLFDDAKGVFLEMLDDLEKRANTEEVVVALSDTKNWRRNVLPTYKFNRAETRKPVAYYELLDYVRGKFETLKYPGLEADDVMGIYASDPGTVIWSLDKDMKQVPGLHLIDDDFYEITKEEADRFHLYQTLKGDPTDGYNGCPGVGDVVANEFLDSPYVLERKEEAVKSTGKTREVWKKTPTDDVWAGIVSLYEKAGQTEADALVQARVARILRKGEYDFQNKRVRLWKPTTN